MAVMNNGENLLVLSGPSGSGKDTLMKEILTRDKNMHLSISATTRPMRKDEEDGINYYFVSKEEFEQKIECNGFLEYTIYCNNYYGTLKSEVDEHLKNGESVALVIEVEGAASIKNLYPNCTAIFIKPPSMNELERRLRLRGTEDEEDIIHRMERAKEELMYAKDYDYVIVNDSLEECTNDIERIFSNRQAM
jgi:guanylate kinase